MNGLVRHLGCIRPTINSKSYALRVAECLNKEEIVSTKRIYQHELFVKYAFHLNTLLSLIDGTSINLQIISAKYIDYPSIITIIRSSLETYLTYYFIFVDPKNDDDKIFRYNNWFIDGLNQRQKMEVGFDEKLKEQQISEMLIIENSLKEIKSTKAYLILSDKQKDKLNKEKMFIRPGWSEICKLIGISDYWSKAFYNYFCSYAHSTSSCIIQFKTARDDHNSENILKMCVHFIIIISSMFIDSYCKDFNIVDKLSSQNIESIEAWTYLGKNMSRPKI